MRASLAVSLLLLGCEFTIPSGTFTCGGATSRCPPGQSCVDGLCTTGAPPRDAGGMDSGIDAGMDAGATDAGAIDATIPDGGDPDATPSDAGTDDAGLVGCPPLSAPLHGDVDRVEGRPGDVATYSCGAGYVLTGNGGSAERVCGPTGSWSGVAPTCEEVRSPCDPNPCLNGGSCTEDGSSFTCACASGYLPPTCAMRVACPTLSAPAGGRVDRTSGAFGDVATYACDPGLVLSGSPTRTCLADGTWSGTAPSCTPADCAPALVAPANGSVDRTTGPPGTVATFSCDDGFALSGAPTRTCQAGGAWSGESPTCIPSWNGAWLVGVSSGGSGVTSRWITDRWGGESFLPGSPYHAVWGASASAVYVVGVEAGFWDGMRRHNLWIPGMTTTLRAVTGTSATDVWTVGDGGESHHWDGAAWTTVSTGSVSSLRGLWASSPTNVWAVGTGGAALRWNGSAWSPVSTGVGAQLDGVWGSAPDAVWAVGASGTILRWRGASWSGVPALTARDLHAVWGAAANDVWVVGDAGTILHWDGSAWASVPSGTSNALRGVWGRAADDVWAVGQARTLLHWDGARWTTLGLYCPPNCISGDNHAIWGP
ncbi:MAG: hypothetical protein KF729_01765 [Sandaracinaceae bacterium]|nr:hypothetical protein [Sandaracinaceae bacterium]